MGAERTLKKVLMIVLAIFVAAAVLVFVLTHLFRGEPRTLELGSFETAATLQLPGIGPRRYAANRWPRSHRPRAGHLGACDVCGVA